MQIKSYVDEICAGTIDFFPVGGRGWNVSEKSKGSIFNLLVRKQYLLLENTATKVLHQNKKKQGMSTILSL